MKDRIFYLPIRIKTGDALPFCRADEDEYTFIHHMFLILYDRLDLLQKRPYRRLYGELIDYLYRITTENSIPEELEKNQLFFWRRIREGLSSAPIEEFPKSRINAYLEHRQSLWEEHTRQKHSQGTFVNK